MIFVFVGSSGSGKSRLGKEYFGSDREVVSFTTRKKREDEVNEIDYIFLTKEKAQDLLAQKSDEIIEYSIYDNNYYGTLKSELDAKKENDCFMVLDINGYNAIKKLYPSETFGVFVNVTKDNLYNRLVSRGESKSFIENRLNLFDYEQTNINKLDFTLDNNKSIEETLKSLDNFVKSIES